MPEIPEAEAPSSDSFDLDRSEKETLLEEYAKERKRVKNISFRNLLYLYLMIFLLLAILMPKIYISNQIYYLSRNINDMYHKYTALLEEQAALQRELERIRYRINVIDQLSSQSRMDDNDTQTDMQENE